MEFFVDAAATASLLFTNMPVVTTQFGLHNLVHLTRLQRYKAGLELTQPNVISQLLPDSSIVRDGSPTGVLYTIDIDHAGTKPGFHIDLSAMDNHGFFTLKGCASCCQKVVPDVF